METKNVRPSWDEYFLELSDIVASRATCDRGKSGCVLVKDKRVLATGYVGSPSGIAHCDDVGHLIREVTYENGETKQHCVRTIHAEQNALAQAAKHGIAVQGATLYCKMEPCRVCAMMIISVGISRVVCRKLYQAGGDTRDMFKEAGIELVVTEHEVEKY